MSYIRMLEDAQKAIHNLMEQNEILRKERDAAVEDIRILGCMGQDICSLCVHFNHGEGNKNCIPCFVEDMGNFSWRGVKHG